MSKKAKKNMEVFNFYDKPTGTHQFVVQCTETKECAIIDAVWDYDPANGRLTSENCDKIVAKVKEINGKVKWILSTHAHADHVDGAAYLKNKFPDAKTAIGSKITLVQEVFKPIFNLTDLKTDGSQFDKLFDDNEEFNVGKIKVKVLHTPGHTPACASWVFNNEAIFVGDTLFMPDSGTARCDFPKGSAETLYKSIQRLLAYPKETKLYLCHDYKDNANERYMTTVGDERAANIHVADGKTEDEFIKFRTERDATLAVPRLIIPSIQMNIDAGRTPKPDKNGISYLKWPVNQL